MATFACMLAASWSGDDPDAGRLASVGIDGPFRDRFACARPGD